MPVLESADGGTSRSSLRYRSLDETSKRSIVTTATHPVIQRASRVRPRPADDDLISEWTRGDVKEPERVTNPEREMEALRKVSQPAWRASSDVKRLTNAPASPSLSTRRASSDVKLAANVSASAWSQKRARAHPLLFLSLGMLGMVALWVLLSASLGWWNGMLDDLHYGYPRTFQEDAVVGHHDSASNPSHFIALNLHGHIEIIEFPGGDATHTRIYTGPQLFGGLFPIVLDRLYQRQRRFSFSDSQRAAGRGALSGRTSTVLICLAQALLVKRKRSLGAAQPRPGTSFFLPAELELNKINPWRSMRLRGRIVPGASTKPSQGQTANACELRQTAS